MTATVRVSYPKGDPLARLSRVEVSVYRAAEGTVSRYCTLIERDARKNLTDAGKVDTGATRASIDSRVFSLPGVVRGVVFAGALWAQWVEYGRRGSRKDPTRGDPRAARPAWPPVTAIREWVRRNAAKLGVGGVTRGGRPRRPGERDVDEAAYLIGRKIAREGIRPTPFLAPAYNRWVRDFTRALAAAFAAAIKGTP